MICNFASRSVYILHFELVSNDLMVRENVDFSSTSKYGAVV